MKKKQKKFQISLDEELKPDLTYYIEYFEESSKVQVNKIFGIGEKTEEVEQPFKMEEIYRTSSLKKEEPKPNPEFLSFLDSIQDESMRQAAEIFKNK